MNEWTNGEMDVDTGWNDGCVDVWGVRQSSMD